MMLPTTDLLLADELEELNIARLEMVLAIQNTSNGIGDGWLPEITRRGGDSHENFCMSVLALQTELDFLL